MNTLTFLLSTVIELYTMVLLLRIWMQWARVILQPLLTVCSEGNAPLSGHCAALFRQWGQLTRLAAGCLYSQFYQSHRAV